MAAVHLDNWLFFLLVAVAMLFRWLASAANKATKKPNETEPGSTSTPPAVPRAAEESDTDRVRKFLEALGQPPGTEPPRRVTPRAQTPTPSETIKRTVLPHVPPPLRSPLPPLTTRPPELPRKIKLPGQFTTPPYEQKIFRPTVADTSAFEVQPGVSAPEPPPPMITTPAAAYAAVTEQKAPPLIDKVDVITLLRSPSGLRNAIILREIFGPPRSLQDVDLVGSA